MSNGRALENVDGVCVEKNKERKDRVIRCRFDVDVEEDCERIDVDIAVTSWI